MSEKQLIPVFSITSELQAHMHLKDEDLSKAQATLTAVLAAQDVAATKQQEQLKAVAEQVIMFDCHANLSVLGML